MEAHKSVIDNSKTKRSPKPHRFLTEEQVESLIKAARKHNRWPIRDVAMLRMMFNHGLRVSELCNLTREDIEGDCDKVWIKRLKKVDDDKAWDSQPISPALAKALRAYLKPRLDTCKPLFITERGSQFTRQAIYFMVRRLGVLAGLGEVVHPHRLRHAIGFKLINDGVPLENLREYLGHSTDEMTRHYAKLSSRKYDCIQRHVK